MLNSIYSEAIRRFSGLLICSIGVLFSTFSHAQSSALTGVWQGSYKCGQGATGSTLEVQTFDGQQGQGVFSFYNLAGQRNAASGSYQVDIYRPAGQQNITIKPKAWIKQPGGYSMVGFTLNQAGSALNGNVDFGGCDSISLKRQDKSANTMEDGKGANQPATVNQGRPLANTQDSPGIWQGLLSSHLGSIKRANPVSLTLIDTGGILHLDSLTQSCKWLISAQANQQGQFSATVYRGKPQNCKNGTVSLNNDGDKLVLANTPLFNQPLVLQRHLGPVERPAGEPVPDFKVLGVGLGNMVDKLQDLSEAPKQFKAGQHDNPQGNRRFVNAEMPLNALYSTVVWPFNTHPNAHQDVLSAYAVRLRGNHISAIQRIHRPMPNSAPNASAYAQALLAQYGTPSQETAKHKTRTFTWHYDRQAKLLPATQAARCTPENPNDRDQLRARISTEYAWFKLYHGKVTVTEQTANSTLIPVSDCGFTLTYSLTAQDNGTVDRLSAVAFDHTAIANSIWQDRARYAKTEVSQQAKRLEKGANAKLRL